VPTASKAFDGGLSCVRDARRFLSAVLRDWGATEFEFGAPQVLSELVTNAALHARTAFTVTVRLAEGCLLMEVSDASPRLPRPRRYSLEATTGRGIGLVAALSDDWGTTAAGSGKTVWARVRPDGVMPFDLDDDLADFDLVTPGEPGPAAPGLSPRVPDVMAANLLRARAS
jgi:Histidine kinase-like ATPase domain